MKTTLLTVLFLGATQFFAVSALCAEPAAPPPATHKAIYKMALASAKSSTVVDIKGEMYYDFIDSCDAWTTDQKFSLDYLYADQPEEKLTSQYSSREGKNGETYDFAVRRLKDGNLQEEHIGNASRNADGTGIANYTQSEKKEVHLPRGFFFPTQHTSEIIAHALAGDRIFNAEMFDGSDGEGALEVNVVIGDVLKPEVGDALAGNPLLQSPARRVRLAFYDPDSDANKKDMEAEPDYEMTMILHENGVVSSMQIDYDQFSLKGELEAIEAAPTPKC